MGGVDVTAARAATAVTANSVRTLPALRTTVVEPVGAGDAFAAGFLAGLPRGGTTVRALRLGHITAVSALKVTGDHGPLPDTAETERLLGLPDADRERCEDRIDRVFAQ